MIKTLLLIFLVVCVLLPLLLLGHHRRVFLLVILGGDLMSPLEERRCEVDDAFGRNRMTIRHRSHRGAVAKHAEAGWINGLLNEWIIEWIIE